MRPDKTAMTIIMCLVVAVAGAAWCSPAAANPFFDFHGYSYLQGAPFQVGTHVFVPTLLNTDQPDPIWPLDFANNEYTVMVNDLVITDVSVNGPMLTVTYQGGTIGLYRDGSKNASWAPNPPNSQVPATFVDGTADLLGEFTEMVMIYNTTTGTGTISGLIDWTGGDKLASLDNPAGWTYFGGVSDHDGLGRPAGFDLTWDPQIYGPAPVPVQQGSWGDLKNLYLNGN